MSLNYIIANINYYVTTKYEWKNRLVNGDLILCPDLAFVNERSGYEINGDPVFIGPYKFLNGEKLAGTHLSITRDPRNLASFRMVNITAICNRICTVTCKRVARVKNSTVQKFVRTRTRGFDYSRK